MLLRLKHLFRKEIIQVWRDPHLRLFVFLLPLLQILLYGYAINFDVEHVPTAVFDESRTFQSREFISRFTATRFFDLNYFVNDEQEVRDLLDRGEVTFVLRIPWDFAKQLTAGKTARVQLIVDGTDSNAAQVVSRYANIIISEYALEILQKRLNNLGFPSEESPISLEHRVWFNVNLVSSYSYVPGVIAMVVMLVSFMLTALAIVREKEIGTLEQIMVTPLRPVELMVGLTIPFALLSLLAVVLTTAFAIYWFEVPLRGSIFTLLLGTCFFLFNSVGLGLLISAICRTQQQAMMAGLFLLTPAILLSGLLFPIANMPLSVQYLTYLNPLRYYNIILQDIFLKGVGLATLWPQMAAMALLGSITLTLSVLFFEKRLI
jgi:ABC-2 type transport system permease protein